MFYVLFNANILQRLLRFTIYINLLFWDSYELRNKVHLLFMVISIVFSLL